MILTDFSVQTKILTARRIFCFFSAIRVGYCNHKHLQSTQFIVFFAVWSFFTQDFCFLICFACVCINVEIFIYNIVSVSGK